MELGVRRLAAIVTVCIGLSAGAASPGLAQQTAPQPGDAQAIVQQIHDQAYGKCMSDARLGSGSELQANCSCSADVVVSLLSDEMKQAIADGTLAQFKGPKLKGDEMTRDLALVKTCPRIGAQLQQQCAGKADDPHCQVLQKAIDAAQ
ncbi:MAG TPA: hypothetical protein VHA35_11505 [Dongiaceae bacterium]|nr:hypothetical protein [Dongiaceae bacterium]